MKLRNSQIFSKQNWGGARALQRCRKENPRRYKSYVIKIDEKHGKLCSENGTQFECLPYHVLFLLLMKRFCVGSMDPLLPRSGWAPPLRVSGTTQTPGVRGVAGKQTIRPMLIQQSILRWQGSAKHILMHLL